MKNILIIYPHWPPSNLARVHSARLIVNYLPEFEWHPIILTVEHQFYEEKPDFDLLKTVSEKVEVIYTKATPIKKLRIVGDIGLRGFKYLKKRALEIIEMQKIDFIWIPIPSFYVAMLGPIIYKKTRTPFGIDYIDPWVRDIKNRRNIRSILSLFVAKIAEPRAVKKAALISGVSEDYYKPVLNRNFRDKDIPHIAMPYGFDPNDHKIKIKIDNYPWNEIQNCLPIIYAGAFLPNSALYMKNLFEGIKNLINNKKWNENWHLYFIGTGNYAHKSISKFAKEAGISEFVHEIRQRFPFLHILNFLSLAYRVIVIGSIEKHYTASKIFQALLSSKPVFSIMHSESSTVKILNKANAAEFCVKYFEKENSAEFKDKIEQVFFNFLKKDANWKPTLENLEQFSAKKSAKKLINKIENILNIS